MIVVLMGVCGCGKTTVGEALAAELGWRFFDADDFHRQQRCEDGSRPSAGGCRSLALARPDGGCACCARSGRAVRGPACSALKDRYRDRLRPAGDVRFVYLAGDRATIFARIADRTHRYMPASLLDSQFEALEVPAGALAVDIGLSVADEVAVIRRWLAGSER